MMTNRYQGTSQHRCKLYGGLFSFVMLLVMAYLPLAALGDAICHIRLANGPTPLLLRADSQENMTLKWHLPLKDHTGYLSGPF